jgi:hypothetical protein
LQEGLSANMNQGRYGRCIANNDHLDSNDSRVFRSARKSSTS